MKTVREISDKIEKNSAKVYTAAEFKKMTEENGTVSEESADVVTCGTFGVMSGTMAVFTIPVTGPGVFKKADSITVNGVPGMVGPCPNESLGIVDCVIYGTARRDEKYGGGHLFRDLVRRDRVKVIVVSEGKVYENILTLDDFQSARMILVRGAFKNYTAFVNPSDKTESTIFSGPDGLAGGLREASVSGCGSANPLQNDPEMRFLKSGYPVMINGARGIITGTGTRSTPEKPNLSASADMKDMDHTMMGGFVTSEGAECLTSVAVAIPILDSKSAENASVPESDVKLPLADVRDRIPADYDRYSSVWTGDNSRVFFDENKCIHCAECFADAKCPVDAKPSEGLEGNDLCMACGLCVSTCVGKAFQCDLGSITYKGTEVPITVRQSSRLKAEQLCERLKDEIKSGKWSMEGD